MTDEQQNHNKALYRKSYSAYSDKESYQRAMLEAATINECLTHAASAWMACELMRKVELAVKGHAICCYLGNAIEVMALKPYQAVFYKKRRVVELNWTMSNKETMNMTFDFDAMPIMIADFINSDPELCSRFLKACGC